MPFRPSEMGDGRLHVDLRTGVAGINKWKGVNREGDPASIQDEQFYYLQNARLVGGEVIPRGGQSAVNSSATSGCIDGFFDAGDTGAQEDETYPTPPPAGFFMGALLGTMNGSVAETISSFDPATDSFASVTNTAAGHIRAMAIMDDVFYVAVGPNEDVLISHTATGLTIRKATAISLSAITFDDVATFGPNQDRAYGPTSMAAFNGNLYIGFWDASVFPDVFTVIQSDGVSSAISDETWGATYSYPVLRNFTAENVLIAKVQRSSDNELTIKTRTVGGTWTTYVNNATGSGGQTSFYHESNKSDGATFPIEFNSTMFCLGHFTVGSGVPLTGMLTFASGAFATDQEFSGYTEAQNSAAVFNNCLYFMLKRDSDNHRLLCKRTTTGTYTIGEYDFGTSNVQALFSNATNLYAVVGPSGGNVDVYKSNGTTTSSFSSVDTLASLDPLAYTGVNAT